MATLAAVGDFCVALVVGVTASGALGAGAAVIVVVVILGMRGLLVMLEAACVCALIIGVVCVVSFVLIGSWLLAT